MISAKDISSPADCILAFCEKVGAASAGSAAKERVRASVRADSIRMVFPTVRARISMYLTSYSFRCAWNSGLCSLCIKIPMGVTIILPLYFPSRTAFLPIQRIGESGMSIKI
jgi:hypothetical protein